MIRPPLLGGIMRIGLGQPHPSPREDLWGCVGFRGNPGIDAPEVAEMIEQEIRVLTPGTLLRWEVHGDFPKHRTGKAGFDACQVHAVLPAARLMNRPHPGFILMA